MIYSGVPEDRRACSGVTILINNKWKSKIISYSFINDRIVTGKFRIDKGYLIVVSVYAHEKGMKEEIKKFYDNLKIEVNKINKEKHFIMCGDLNARIGN